MGGRGKGQESGGGGGGRGVCVCGGGAGGGEWVGLEEAAWWGVEHVCRSARAWAGAPAVGWRGHGCGPERCRANEARHGRGGARPAQLACLMKISRSRDWPKGLYLRLNLSNLCKQGRRVR